MNELENKEGTEQAIPSSGASPVEGKEPEKTEETGQVQTSEPNTFETNGELIALQEHYEAVETHLDNLTTIGVAIIIGIGLLFGSLAIKSFFDFLR